MSGKTPAGRRWQRGSRNFPRRFFHPRRLSSGPESRSETDAPDVGKNAWEKFAAAINTASTVIIALGAVVTGIVAYYQWRALNSTDRTMDEQLQVMRQSLAAGERPWLALTDVTLLSDIANNPQGTRARVRFTLRNVGRTPARGVGASPRLYVMSPSAPDLLSAQERTCEQARTYFPKLGAVVFPNETTTYDFDLSISGEAIDDAVRGKTRETLSYVVFGCVTYGFTFDDTVHQTRFMFNVERKPVMDSPGSPSAEITKGMTIPASDVILAKHVLGFAAD